MREKKSVRQVTLSSLTLEMEKGNFDGSVLQGVWMAVSGGGQTWVISWWRKKTNQQSLETRGNASNFFPSMLWQLNEGLFYTWHLHVFHVFPLKLYSQIAFTPSF